MAWAGVIFAPALRSKASGVFVGNPLKLRGRLR